MENENMGISDIPKTIIEEKNDDFIFNLNEIGELRISNVFNPYTYVLEGKTLLALINVLRHYSDDIKPKLFQLHHQSEKDYSTKMISQAEIYCQAQMNEWCKEVTEKYPLADGYRWLMCNEDSKNFMKCSEESIFV